MRLHTLLIALFMIGARAATIADKAEIEFEKKLTDVVKQVLNKETIPENIASDQELIDQVNSVKDVENNLRNRVQIADIPVKIVVEDIKPSLKSDCEKQKETNEIVPASEENSDLKRTEIDLKNPGAPQRQQHETQNPEHYEEQQQGLSGIKQNIIDTQNVFNNGIIEYQQNLQNWWQSNQQLIQIQQNIENLQQNFQTQINKFNDTLQKFWKPNVAEPVKQEIRGSENEGSIQSGLTVLQNNLNAGVKSLAEGVKAVASVKQGSESPGGAGAGTGPFAIYLQTMQQQIQQGFQNMTNQLQQYFNSSQQQNNGETNVFQNWGQGVQNLINQQGTNQPGSAQSDESSPSRPTIWQSVQNFFNPQAGQAGQAGQVQQDTPVSQPSGGPIVQAIQNSPLYQGVVSLIQPNKPAASKPENAKPEANKPVEEKPVEDAGTNVVPEETKPDTTEKQKPELVQTAQAGPITQIIQKNPIVQGIAGAVQRIQHTITNPERPRDNATEDEKGIIVIPIEGGHGGHGGHKPGHKPGQGVADDDNGRDSRTSAVSAASDGVPEVNSDAAAAVVPKDDKAEEQVAPQKEVLPEEPKNEPQVVSDKTE